MGKTSFSPSLQSCTRVKEVLPRVTMVARKMMSTRTSFEHFEHSNKLPSSITNLCPTSKTLDPQQREVVCDREDGHEVIKSVGLFLRGCISKIRPSVDKTLLI